MTRKDYKILAEALIELFWDRTELSTGTILHVICKHLRNSYANFNEGKFKKAVMGDCDD